MDIIPRENRVLDPWMAVDERLDLMAALAQLTDKQREAVTLWAMGYTQAEIGERCGVGRPAITRRIRRGIEALRERM